MRVARTTEEGKKVTFLEGVLKLTRGVRLSDRIAFCRAFSIGPPTPCRCWTAHLAESQAIPIESKDLIRGQSS
jgi:hypothetical protein